MIKIIQGNKTVNRKAAAIKTKTPIAITATTTITIAAATPATT